MTTATKPKPAAKAHRKAKLDVPVEFGGVSIGEDTARIGVTVSRRQLALADADENLCCRRLTGTIRLDAGGAPDQQLLDGFEPDDPEELVGVFDVKKIGVTEKTIGCGLTFALGEIAVDRLAHFAGRAGRLVVTDVDDLPEPPKKGKAAAPPAREESEEAE